MKRAEQPVQMSIVKYLTALGYLFTAPDAGINISSPRLRAIYKAMGRRSGISDLIVWIPNGTVCIEVKRPKVYRRSLKTGKQIIADEGGKQSEEQKEFESKIKSISGHYYLVAKDVNDVIKFFKENNIVKQTYG